MMKSILILLISIFYFANLALGQEVSSGDSKTVEIRIRCGTPQIESALYIIKHKNEELVLEPKNMKEDHVFEEIKPSQVKAVSVLKDEKGVRKYGESGKNGVVIITVTKRFWKRYAPSQKKQENN